jgi:hypothetical protein
MTYQVARGTSTLVEITDTERVILTEGNKPAITRYGADIPKLTKELIPEQIGQVYGVR